MKLTKIICFILCMTFGVAFAGNAPNPMIMLNKISNKMIASLKKNRPRLRKNPAYVYKLVNKVVVPHADVLGMSRSVLGRHAWTSSSKSQQRAFTREFKTVVIRTYASALNAYTDETIRFDPIRGGYQGRRRIQVQSYVVRQDGPPIPVSYRLALKKGKWKMYDLNVEGVSLLQSFRAQFADQLSHGKSVAQITRDLKARNKRTRRKKAAR